MKTRKKQFPRILSIVLTILLYLNSIPFFGQDVLEDAQVSLSFSEADSIKTIIATVTDKEGVPIEDIELYFFVQRTFSLLPFGDFFNATDENGLVEVVFPNDLPGDTAGDVTIYVKITEADMYNDLSIEIIKNWGIPTVIDVAKEKRSLWASAANAPLSLITVVSLMIFAVWYVIFFIIFKLFKISRIKK